MDNNSELYNRLRRNIMNYKIFIVGGDGFARECASYILEQEQSTNDIEFGGFLGHNGYHIDFKSQSHFFRGDISEHKFQENEYVVIGAGYPELRHKIYMDLKKRDIKLYNLIAKGCFIHSSVVMGEGNVFIPPFRSSVDMKIGNGNVFNGGVNTGHDNIIGDFNFFGPRSQILGSVIVGSYNIIGANSVLLPNCKIGNNNKISPLSAVYRGCGNNCYMHGSPAIKIGVIEQCQE